MGNYVYKRKPHFNVETIITQGLRGQREKEQKGERPKYQKFNRGKEKRRSFLIKRFSRSLFFSFEHLGNKKESPIFSELRCNW